MKIYKDFDLADILYYKIGGKARLLIDIIDRKDVEEAFKLIKKEKINNVFFLGLGTNLIFSPEYYDGAIIRFVPGSIRLLKSNSIEADAGVVLDDVIQFAFEHNLIGLEWAGGLPGDVGAAIRGNVGAFGGEIKDNTREAEVFEVVNNKPKFKTLSKTQLGFRYRDSIIKRKGLGVTKAIFRLKKATPAELSRARQTYLNNKEYRKIRHPLEYPNCGSVFKNISDPEHVEKVLEVFPDLAEKIKRDWHGKVAMGYLIKRLDLSEYRIGDAMVSPKHCNFIVNLGHARATDVMSIIKHIQEKFAETFDFTPEVEVEIVE